MFQNKKVRKALIDADLTITHLAEITGFTREHLSSVINGNVESKRAEKIIALALKMRPEDLWDRFRSPDL